VIDDEIEDRDREQGWNCRGLGLTSPPVFMSTDAHF